MKVVFFEDVEGTAHVGEIKEVKNGFARNYLLPRGIAGPTTKENLQRANALAQREARRQEKLDAEARVIAAKLENLAVSIEARVGETGRLFGSVTNRDIAAAIKSATGVELEHQQVLLPEPIRELGRRAVEIKFTRNVSAEVAVDVIPDASSKAIAEKLAAQAQGAAESE
ncbi:50S ribosomal protein L9 [Tepidiforma sp.]|uniref:50S ribosomal protein L9 n=1 Tax=Tepidiforma sp. TaxID=2682230 RepID=UPI0026112A2C|nr:50S ribosomal protein L9 [Tepidiforma sp.]MCX7616679.1 50S ribosomal protein L9 [Tepidiforma sp.]